MEVSLMVSVAMLSLATLSYLYSKGDLFHPAVVFPAVWGVTTLAISIAKSFGYFQISESANLIFLIGSNLFVSGALAVKIKPNQTSSGVKFNINFKSVIIFCFCLHVLIAPLAWSEMNKISGGFDNIFVASYQLRVKSVSGEENVGAVVGNYLVVGSFFIPLLLIGWLQRKVNFKILIILSLPWLLLNILVGGRSGLISIILSSIYIYAVLDGKIPIKAGLFFILSFVLVLVVGNLLVGKIDATADSSYLSILQESMKGFFDYYLQGPILFSEYLREPNSITPTWDAFRFPCYVLEKLSLCKSPSLHQQFKNFSQSDGGNVYSMYFSIFPPYGWPGLFLITPLYGYWIAFHHARRFNNLYHIMMGALLFSSVLLSIFLDNFGPSIYFFLKIIILSVAVSHAFRKT